MSFFKFNTRDASEAHRVATPLELMFDLASVIAIAAAAAGLHHGIAEGHALEALPGFLIAFFMVWWSWMNYTWFASAYDDGSPAFRVISMVAMFGAVMIAAGVPAVFSHEPIFLCLFGFVVMRIAMALLWFGAAAGDPTHRKTALTYGVGIVVLQIYWVWLVFSAPPDSPLYTPLFLLGILGEVSVPTFAESRHRATAWHRHHIMERYGLLNIIVLGECFLSIVAILAVGDTGQIADGHAVLTAVTCGVITFGLWGVYYTREEHLSDDVLRRAMIWGYGHFAIFAAGAATGAGFAVFHEVTSAHAEVGPHVASLAVAVPLAIYLAMLWAIRDRYYFSGLKQFLLPGAAALILASTFVFEEDLVAMALLMTGTVVLRRSLRPSQEKAAQLAPRGPGD